MTDPFSTPGQSSAVEGDLSKDGKFYMLPDPPTEDEGQGDKRKRRTRATTFAGALSETFNLNQWKIRMTVQGMIKREDLMAQAAAIPDLETTEGKRALGEICEQAQIAAGSRKGANLGTVLHSFTERTDKGEPLSIVPTQYRADVAAYHAALEREGLEILSRYVERRVLVERYNVAGTLDRIVRDKTTGTLYILDVKTARDLSFAVGEIKVQLALYANADWLWSSADQAYEIPPVVDRDRALIAWMPVGQGKCEILTVDIREGWDGAALCEQVRKWRATRAHKTDAWIPGELIAESRIEVPFPHTNHPCALTLPQLDPEVPRQLTSLAGMAKTTMDQLADNVREAAGRVRLGQSVPLGERLGLTQFGEPDPLDGVDVYIYLANVIKVLQAREELERLWTKYQNVWTDELTKMGQKRLSEISR